MNNLKFFGAALFIFGATINAQDLASAKKVIDAEQYDKAKSMLKGLITAKPDSGKNYFVLGNLYLTQKLQDSAAIMYNKGLTVKQDANFNNIGLGQIALENNKDAEAKVIFDNATKTLKKKDFEELMYIGKAYMNNVKPDFKTAIPYLERAKAIQPNDSQLLLYLGDAYYGDRRASDAYPAYRDSFDADKTFLRAKLQLARVKKESKAYDEAKLDFENIVATNPTYGPAYRELAETYFSMGLNNKEKYAEYNKTAMEYYEKYMSKTDYSLDSRMRHADFLMLTRDYVALEAEASAMQKLDKVNPRILRYLGYSAYHTGKSDVAIKALNDFLANDKAKIIGRDYLYLGLAKTKKSLTSTTGADAKVVNTIDKALFDTGVADLRKGVEMDPVMANEINDIGKVFFDLKLYKEAASIYEVSTINPNSRNFVFDSYYFAYATYFEQANSEKPDFVILQKAVKSFTDVTIARPTFQDAYLYKARIYGLQITDETAKAEMVKNYEDFIRVVMAKTPADQDKAKKKLIEAHNTIAVYYIKTDKVKAKENLDKVLALDPTDAEALGNSKFVK